MGKQTRFYNPLSRGNLGRSIVSAILKQPYQPLPPLEPFPGAGIYALYYMGGHKLYEAIGRYNQRDPFGAPIYVGKAVPEGARKGGLREEAYNGFTLYRRLAEHADSVASATDLEIEEFRCRFLPLDDIWIPLGENLLIEAYNPVWNQIIDGFGNHDPGSRRGAQKRSVWDSLHPGRPWATKLSDLDPDYLQSRIKLLQNHMGSFDPALATRELLDESSI